MKAVILIGFMGAGKSTVGRALAERLSWGFEDLDEVVERREGKKVPEIFQESGEVGFRAAEHGALRELLDALPAAMGRVIALGGGTFVQESNAELIESARIQTAFLDADVEELWERCRKQAQLQQIERPMLNNAEVFRDLYESRRSHYLRAGFRQETGGKCVEQIVDELVAALGLTHTRARRGEQK